MLRRWGPAIAAVCGAVFGAGFTWGTLDYRVDRLERLASADKQLAEVRARALTRIDAIEARLARFDRRLRYLETQSRGSTP